MRRLLALATLALSLANFSALAAEPWKASSPTKKLRSEAAAIEHDGGLYVFNGFGPKIRIEPSVERYDIASGQWQVVSQTSANKGNAVTHNGLVVVNDEAWLIGGRIGTHPGRVSDKVWIYNFDSRAWRQGPKLPIPVAAGGAAVVNNAIHWFGGLDPQARCDVNRHFKFELNARHKGWQNITAKAGMPSPRNHFSTVVSGNRIFAVGGQFGHDKCPGNSGRDSKLVHVFNPANNQWSRLADLPYPTSHAEPGTFAHEGKIFVTGGQLQGNRILQYTIADNQWKLFRTLPGRLLAPVARIVNGKFLVAGGGAPNTINPTTKTHYIPFASNKPAPTPVVVATPNTDKQPSIPAGTITVEAENYDTLKGTSSHRWIRTTRPGASGNAAMVTTPDSGSLKFSSAGAPMMSYFVRFDRAGKHHVWVRGWGDTNSKGEGKSDSLHLGLNGTLQAGADKIDRFPARWSWSRNTRDNPIATLNVPSAGIHAVNVWMREDGLAIDKFVITPAAGFVPSGIGPASDDGTSDDSSAPVNTPPVSEATDNGTGDNNNNNNNPPTDSQTPANSDNGTGSVSSNGSQIIVIEAEDFDNSETTKSHKWVNAARQNASGTGSVVTTPDQGSLRNSANNSPMLSYFVIFKQPGKHYVWVRGWGDTNSRGEGKSDSVHIGLDGKLQSGADKIDRFPAGWNWSRTTRDGVNAHITVPNAGLHAVNLWMREDGLSIDKLVITSDLNYVPKGQGPVRNDGATSDNQGTESNSGNNPGSGNTSSGANDPTSLINAFRAWDLVQTSNGSRVEARHEAGAVAVNGKLYVMGGRGNEAVQSYNPATRKWSSHGKPPVLMHHFQPVAIGKDIYVIGAFATNRYPRETALAHIWIYNTDTRKWRRGMKIPANRLRGSMGAAVYQNRIYLVGGNRVGHSGQAVKWLDEFNPKTNQWKALPDAPHARDHAPIAIAEGKLIVAGGRRSRQPNVFANTEAATDVFNLKTRRWEKSASNIPTPRAGTMTVAHGHEVIVIGGESTASKNAHRNVEALDVRTGRWRKLQPLTQGRHSGGAGVISDTIHVVSGNATRGGGREISSHEILLSD